MLAHPGQSVAGRVTGEALSVSQGKSCAENLWDGSGELKNPKQEKNIRKTQTVEKR